MKQLDSLCATNRRLQASRRGAVLPIIYSLFVLLSPSEAEAQTIRPGLGFEEEACEALGMQGGEFYTAALKGILPHTIDTDREASLGLVTTLKNPKSNQTISGGLLAFRYRQHLSEQFAFQFAAQADFYRFFPTDGAVLSGGGVFTKTYDRIHPVSLEFGTAFACGLRGDSELNMHETYMGVSPHGSVAFGFRNGHRLEAFGWVQQPLVQHNHEGLQAFESRWGATISVDWNVVNNPQINLDLLTAFNRGTHTGDRLVGTVGVAITRGS